MFKHSVWYRVTLYFHILKNVPPPPSPALYSWWLSWITTLLMCLGLCKAPVQIFRLSFIGCYTVSILYWILYVFKLSIFANCGRLLETYPLPCKVRQLASGSASMLNEYCSKFLLTCNIIHEMSKLEFTILPAFGKQIDSRLFSFFQAMQMWGRGYEWSVL